MHIREFVQKEELNSLGFRSQLSNIEYMRIGRLFREVHSYLHLESAGEIEGFE
jgi:hypothetical protein